MSDTATTARPRLGRDYWKLLSATGMTNLGDGLMTVAVVWLASALTRDPLLIALVALTTRLPWLLFSLPAGVITDRFDRRLLVAWMDVGRFVVVAAFGVLVLLAEGGLPTPEQLASGEGAPASATLLLIGLYVMSFLVGCAEVVRDNAAQTLLPAVVDQRLLEKANGRLWGVEVTTNQFVGPPLAGVLMGLALTVPFLFNAGLLAVSAALLFTLAGTYRPRGVDASTGRIAWRAEIGTGFRWLWSHPVLRALALLLGALNLASAMVFPLLVLYTQDVLGLFEGWQFGLILTGAAAGALAGSLLAERIIAVLGEGRCLLGSIVILGLGFAVIGALPVTAVVWLSGVVSGVAIVVWNVITVSLRQRIIPDHLLGRVNSVYRFFGWGTLSVGTLLGGLLVAGLEPALGREWALRLPFLLAGAVHLPLLLFAWRRVNGARMAQARAEAPERV
ncbi:MFS transporter [Nocardiopsis exhalans]|uniref:MFS transporter n=1 Tax=Nocardiopsis exhalans TaxID=163604 RepID=A0ABY5D2C7_9ACTN|nr:MFS transporter [Nocardiopsis exhalans]USY17337.1 MFS transporter [Nocardiopsis exhalans]